MLNIVVLFIISTAIWFLFEFLHKKYMKSRKSGNFFHHPKNPSVF